MRKLLSLFFAVAITMSGVMGVSAQDAESSVSAGVGSTALWTNDQGDPMATLEVTDVVEGWDEYEDRSAPSRGYTYYAVHFTVSVVGDDDVEIDSSRFRLVDSQGLSNSRENVNQTRESTANIISSRFSLTSGAFEDATLVYELFDDVTPELFIWQPNNNTMVIVDLSDGEAVESSSAYGLNAPAMISDDRGNPLGSIEVTEIEEGWSHHSDNQAPDRGYRYVAVHFVVTNSSDDVLDMNPRSMNLVDQESALNGRANVRADDNAPTPISSDRLDLAPGEAYEGMLVFTLYDGVEPAAWVWSPNNNMLGVVILTDDADTGIDATPEDDVVVDDEDDEDDLDVEATPAA